MDPQSKLVSKVAMGIFNLKIVYFFFDILQVVGNHFYSYPVVYVGNYIPCHEVPCNNPPQFVT